MEPSGPPAPKPQVPDRAALVTYVDNHLDQVVARHQGATDAIWRENSEVGKTLITLASGALVLSVSVAQVFADKVGQLTWTWLLPASWILFALTVLMGASRQAWSAQAQSFRARLEGRRQAILTRLWSMPPSSDLGSSIDAIVQEELSDADSAPRRALLIHDRLGAGMYFAFAAGLISLMTFAIRNLPF
jgi:hypothetical protein